MGNDGRYIPNELTNFRWHFKRQQKEAAIALGIRQSKLSDWEQGRVMPNGDHLLDLCNYYETTVQALYPEHNQASKERLSRNKKAADNHDHEKVEKSEWILSIYLS